jgi:hydrogenase nickel incorporation protein HypA/HybF
MHEVSIMEQTLDIALSAARQQGAGQIHRLSMRIGEMSGVVADALRFAFDVVTQNTIAEGAILDIETVAVSCQCQHCGTTFHPPDLIFECPRCGSRNVQVLSGKEIELASLEVSE